MRGGGGRLRNPCLTMHQPWASLLVHGIKRVEGRSWPSPLTGRLWIHAASKVPDPDTISAMEAFYTEIYAVDGITDITFPQHYPVSRLLGCVDVVGCLTSQDLASWEHVPQSVRLEALTDFCWLCQNPQKLVVPFEMRGQQGVYNLERRIYEGAVRGLSPVQGPLPVNFPLPDPTNPLSLKPGSLQVASSKSSPDKSPSVTAAIAGARAATTQYSRKNHNNLATTSSPTEQTRQRFHSQSPADSSTSANTDDTLPSIAHNISPYLSNHGIPSIVHNTPIVSQNHNLPSLVHNNWPSLQNQNLPYLQHQNLPTNVLNRRESLLQNQSPSSLVQSGQSYLQNQNSEPQRSPRLQNQSGAPSRWH
uniref:ASCH domain-containing protein n=1 Tax=Leersia perrieri TaxID=77586 RepID=A0A0D9W1N4_9ORYZ